jgi:phage-related protein
MAMEIFKLIGSVFVDTDKADKSLKKTDKTAGGLGQKLLAVGKSAGTLAVGMAGAAAAAGAALIGVAESTREYRTEQGKLQAAFDASGHSAEAARSTYSALNGVLGDSGQAVEAANHLAKLTDNEKDLQTWTNICTGVFATFGDSLPIEGLTEAANETAKVGTLTGGLADALNWAGVNEETFQAQLDACSTEQERQALITETLNGLYSDAADAYRDVNGEIINANIAQDNLNSAMAGIGAAVEPFLTMGKQLLADVLVQLTPILSSLAETVIPWLSSALTTIATVALPLFTAALDWVSVNVLPLLTTALSTVGGWFDSIKTKLSESGVTFSSVMSVVQALFSGAMAVIQTIWTTIGQPVWDLIKQNVGLVYNLFMQNMPAIQQFVTQAFAGIKEIWEKNLKPALEAVGKFISNVLAPAFKFVFETIIAPVVSAAFSGIVDLWNNSLKPGLQAILDFVTKVFKADFSGAFSSLVEAVGKIFGGITTVLKTPLNGVINIVNSFIGKINRLEIPEWVPGIGGKGLDIPLIPKLEKGGVLEKGQIGFLEGNGAEAVVPLHQNKAWISKVAEDMDTAVGGASGGQMVSLLVAILAQLEEIAQMGIYLDSDKLVGGIAKKMDRRLGQLQAQKARA